MEFVVIFYCTNSRFPKRRAVSALLNEEEEEEQQLLLGEEEGDGKEEEVEEGALGAMHVSAIGSEYASNPHAALFPLQ